jgi:hypothetical protein
MIEARVLDRPGRQSQGKPRRRDDQCEAGEFGAAPRCESAQGFRNAIEDRETSRCPHSIPPPLRRFHFCLILPPAAMATRAIREKRTRFRGKSHAKQKA